MHDHGLAHGDLKPQNILIEGDGNGGFVPLLVDLLDFSCKADGDVRNTAYAPATGGRFECDRFATTKVVEEILSKLNIGPGVIASIGAAISTCRKGPPENATLLPLVEALEAALAPPVREVRRKLVLGIANAESGPVLSDEGRVGIGYDRQLLFLRGASEIVEIQLENEIPVWGRRRRVAQNHIARLARQELGTLDADLEVSGRVGFRFEDLTALIHEPKIAELLHNRTASADQEPIDLGPLDPPTTAETAEDALSELVAAEAKSSYVIDVPKLWRRLIEVEGSLTTEGIATGDSGYRKEVRRHIVPFALESGTLDFDRNDKVLIERQDKNGRWAKIGHLDLTATTSSLVHIDTPTWWLYQGERLVAEDQRLRFQSHLETTSRSRREAAVSRILGRQSVVRNLVEYFDPTCQPTRCRAVHQRGHQ